MVRQLNNKIPVSCVKLGSSDNSSYSASNATPAERPVCFPAQAELRAGQLWESHSVILTGKRVQSARELAAERKTGVLAMGEPEKGKTWAMLGWVRREKAVAGLFVALTLVVGILIGTIVSGHTSAMKTMTFAGKGATPLAVPDAIPSSNSFASIVNRVEPAVVNISTTQVLEKRQSLNRKRRQVPNP